MAETRRMRYALRMFDPAPSARTDLTPGTLYAVSEEGDIYRALGLRFPNAPTGCTSGPVPLQCVEEKAVITGA